MAYWIETLVGMNVTKAWDLTFKHGYHGVLCEEGGKVDDDNMDQGCVYIILYHKNKKITRVDTGR